MTGRIFQSRPRTAQRRSSPLYLLAACLLLLAAGCQVGEGVVQPTPGSLPGSPAPSRPVVSEATREAGPAPSPVVEPAPVGIYEMVTPPPEDNSLAVFSPDDPLRFVFPTARPAAISAWRPPLYPTPWAPTEVDHFYFTRPIAADVVNWPLADYRYGGVFFEDVVHTGVDIPAPLRTPVLAAGSGKVTWAGYGLYALQEDLSDPYGLAIAIKHDFGYEGQTLYTVYGHMDEILVTRGQIVEGGQVLGVVGQTGKVTGPHLHFEVRIGKNNFFGSRNPELWISPPQGWGVLAGRVMTTAGNRLERHSVTVRRQDSKQWWEVKSYGKGSVNSDAYYNENLVLGDLPAGSYILWIDYQGVRSEARVEIFPGMVTYFSFRGRHGFELTPPPLPGADFEPRFDTPEP